MKISFKKWQNLTFYHFILVSKHRLEIMSLNKKIFLFSHQKFTLITDMLNIIYKHLAN